MPIRPNLAAGAAAALWITCCCYLQPAAAAAAAAGASEFSSTVASPTVIDSDMSITRTSQANVSDDTTVVSSSTEKVTSGGGSTKPTASAVANEVSQSSSTLAAARNASLPSVTAGPEPAKSESVTTTAAAADNGMVPLSTTTAPSALDFTLFTTQTIASEWLLANWTVYSSTDFVTGWDDSLDNGPSIGGGMIALAVLGSLAGAALITAGVYVAVKKLRKRISYESFGGARGLSNPSYEKFS